MVDGLKGFPEAITAALPDAIVQTCIVHLLRNSMDFVSWKDRKGLATALKEIYRARSAEPAEQALTAFEAGPWGQRYPAIGQSWRRAWAEFMWRQRSWPSMATVEMATRRCVVWFNYHRLFGPIEHIPSAEADYYAAGENLEIVA